MKPKFLRRKGTDGPIHIYTDLLFARGDMEVVDNLEAPKEEKGSEVEKLTLMYEERLATLRHENAQLKERITELEGHIEGADRLAKIKSAIAEIPQEQWGNSPAGSLPKVGDVSEKVGFKVSAAEIKSVLEIKDEGIGTGE